MYVVILTYLGIMLGAILAVGVLHIIMSVEEGDLKWFATSMIVVPILSSLSVLSAVIGLSPFTLVACSVYTLGTFIVWGNGLRDTQDMKEPVGWAVFAVFAFGVFGIVSTCLTASLLTSC